MKILPFLLFCVLLFTGCKKTNNSTNPQTGYNLTFVLGDKTYKYSYSNGNFGADAACFTGYNGGKPIVGLLSPDTHVPLLTFGIPAIKSFSNSDNFLVIFFNDSSYLGHANISATITNNKDSSYSGIFNLNGKVLSQKGTDSLNFSATATVTKAWP
ncbi:MAG TPA: hypothetical protein VGQ53_04830 [Chitinophagaceae bacterium]|jgi:hypothetical protein|nr:hypothetical protein [Chitinophagaceae bacterium]